MTDPAVVAEAVDVFMDQMAHALSVQEPEIRDALLAEFHAGNFRLELKYGEKLSLRIAGNLVMESSLSEEVP